MAGARAAPTAADRPAAELLVVGLGPGPVGWITPEVAAALAEVDHVVGYGALRQPGAAARGAEAARVRQHRRGRPRQVRAGPGPSGRARRRGLRRRRRGLRDGLGGLRGGRGPGVRVRVRAGAARAVSAVQAVAARAGAPIGADFAVVSPLRPAQALVRRRASAPCDRRGRPGAGDLQPCLALAHRAGRGGPEAPARAPPGRHDRGRRSRHRPRRGVAARSPRWPTSTPSRST